MSDISPVLLYHHENFYIWCLEDQNVQVLKSREDAPGSALMSDYQMVSGKCRAKTP